MPAPFSEARERRPSAVANQRLVVAVSGRGVAKAVYEACLSKAPEGDVGGFLVSAHDGGQFQPIEEGHGRQGAQRQPLPLLGPHSFAPGRGRCASCAVSSFRRAGGQSH